MGSLSGVVGQCVDAFGRCAPGIQQSINHTPPHLYDSAFQLMAGGTTLLVGTCLLTGLFQHVVGTNKWSKGAGFAGAAFAAFFAYNLVGQHLQSNETGAEFPQQSSAAYRQSNGDVGAVTTFGASAFNDVVHWLAPNAQLPAQTPHRPRVSEPLLIPVLPYSTGPVAPSR